MIWTILEKDLLRLRRNWVGVAILLAVPLGITAVIGVTFGPAARGGKMPRVKLAIVDEDASVFGSFLTGSLRNEQASEFLDAVITDREEAHRQLADNQISAVVILPKGFTEAYFQGEKPPPIELTKNPAQRYMPAVVEELLLLLVEGLNAVSQNLASDFPQLKAIFEAEGAPDATKLAEAVTQIGKKLEKAEAYLFPPLITYQQETVQGESQGGPASLNIFAYVLPGLVAMFLLYMADGAVRELYREQRERTLQRYRTLRYHLFPFIACKAIYSLTIMLLAAAIMLGGGTIIFHIDWQHPLPVAVLVVAYCVFGAGFIGLLTALTMKETRAAMVNSVVIMLMAFAGGNVMPASELPSVFRNSVSRWLPNYWFNQAIMRLEFGADGPPWITTCVGLWVLGSVMLWASAVLFTRKLSAGTRT